MVIIVTNGVDLPHKEAFVETLRCEVPHTVSVVQNVNDKKTNVIMGPQNYVLYGDDAYHDMLNGLRFKISAHSFFQVNTKQTEVLYDKVMEFAALKPTDTVIDAYCGIGSITLNLAKAAKHVYGVEVVPDAITMAQWNAKENKCENTTFEVGSAEDVMQAWVKQGIHADVVVVDPPRKGLDDAFINATLETAPNRIVYVSCNPITLARNLKNFVDGGYQIETVQPVDMFPQTTHVETVVRLTRKK